jgi:HAD superfamily hydrolase (TIGR01509 family)
MLRILDEAGVEYGEDIIKTITPLGYLGTAEYYINTFGLKTSAEEIVCRMKSYAYDGYAYSIEAKPCVIETLSKLASSGASLNILTASPHTVLDVCLDRLGIRGMFNNIWSCDDFGTTKADPEIYRMAADRIGLPTGEVLFLDDNLNAVSTAVKSGMKVGGVYDKSSEEYTDEIKSATDYYINNFCELLEI